MRKTMRSSVAYRSTDPFSNFDQGPSLNRFTIVGRSYRHPTYAPDGPVAIAFRLVLGVAALMAIPFVTQMWGL